MDDPQFDQFGTVSLGVLLKPPTFQESRVANQYFGHRGVLKTPPCARNSQFGGKAPVKDPRRCFQFIGKRVLWTIAPVLNVHPGICRIFIFFYFPEVQTLFWFFAIWQRNLKQLHPIMFWKLYFFAFALFFFFLFHPAWPFENQCRPGCHAQIVRFFFSSQEISQSGLGRPF